MADDNVAEGPSLDAFAPPLVGPPLVRVRLDLAYDGTDFSGWARQPGRRTVQGVLEAALAMILRVESVALTVAGRTDAGVHADGQVAHLDVAEHVVAEQVVAARVVAARVVAERAVPAPAVLGLATPQSAALAAMVRSLAGVLPPDVRVRAATTVPTEFDARFGALWRRYEYRITDAEWGAPPLRRRDVLAWPRALDVDAMRAAAVTVAGHHDFAAFCKRRDGATSVRTVQAFTVERDEQGLISCGIRADAFCHSMVRSLVGALLAVGEERRPPDWPASLLALRTRANDVPVAPAHGLTLVEVGYPSNDQLAARAAETRMKREPI